jgi:aldose 1-epimerase
LALRVIRWPNRLADGRCRLDGIDDQVALTEPKKHNAIHGFLHWRAWQVLRQTKTRLIMGARLFPVQGYPFLLDVEVDYHLGEEAPSVATTAANAGGRPCAFGAGQHLRTCPPAG